MGLASWFSISVTLSVCVLTPRVVIRGDFVEWCRMAGHTQQECEEPALRRPLKCSAGSRVPSFQWHTQRWLVSLRSGLKGSFPAPGR